MPEPSAQALFVATHLVRGGDAADDGDLAWFHTGAPHEELGGVLVASRDRVDDGLAALAGRPALWHSWPGDDRYDVEDELRRRGFRFVEEEPLMVLDLGGAPALPAPPPGVGLREAEDEPALTEWVRVWSGAQPDPAVVSALGRAGLGDGRRVHHLLAEREGETIGCAAAVVAGDAVAVEHVVTVASHRGRGVGTALTAASVAIGRAAGARQAVLTASPDGAGLYRRLGFEARDRVRRFAARPQ